MTTAMIANTLPQPIEKRGISEAQWRTLKNNLYPGAQSESVLMVWDYCEARQLDPMKKPCHIVPMEVKDAKTGNKEWRDVVMPGIYEYRTTAQRTGEYLGHSAPEFGPRVDVAGVKNVPEWCTLTVYRWNALSQQRVEFPATVYFSEVVATNRDGKANRRWSKAPIQMLTKCTEAAALREGFPDALGGEQTYEEMSGHVINAGTGDEVPVDSETPKREKPEGYDEWLDDLHGVADQGALAFTAAWGSHDDPVPAYRTYLAATEPELQKQLKDRANAHNKVVTT